jgi:hypothetical protein
MRSLELCGPEEHSGITRFHAARISIPVSGLIRVRSFRLLFPRHLLLVPFYHRIHRTDHSTIFDELISVFLLRERSVAAAAPSS